ncbi:MAG: prepilin-type N-terminal cleavage/methylation domain-containing protein [Candidatus Tantalella remota]|nr:prepilin-type N-terminal cleavage/methylation domain-containing protein [Candidatus Tantalella remota]
MDKKGFTIIEIMVVVAIVGLLAGIATPQFLQARMRSRENICVANLRQIANGKDAWAVWEGKQTGDEPGWDDLVPEYIARQPVCPAGGTYTIAPVDAEPTCSIEGHDLVD